MSAGASQYAVLTIPTVDYCGFVFAASLQAHTNERTGWCPDAVEATQRMLSPSLGVVLPAPLFLLIASIRCLIAAEPTLSGMLDWASRGSLWLWSPERMTMMLRNGPGGACMCCCCGCSDTCTCRVFCVLLPYFSGHVCVQNSVRIDRAQQGVVPLSSSFWRR